MWKTVTTRGLLTAVALLVVGCNGQPAAVGSASPPMLKPVTTVPKVSGALSLIQLRMVSASTGWGLAVPGEGRGLGHLVRTTDSGAHWSAIGLPSTLDTPNLDAIDVHDELHAWVLVVLGAESTSSRALAVVASTDDGGIRWVTTPKFSIDGHGTGVQFVDASHGWVFATPGAGGAIGAGDTTLYRTVDGGRHWQAIKPASQVRRDPQVAGTLPEACPMGGPIGQPSFTDAQTGWLGAFCARPFFYVSHDGGLSWATQRLPDFPGPPSTMPPAYLVQNVDSFQRLSASDFVVFVHRGMTTGGNALQESASYVTHDGGSSWSAYRLPVPELAADFVDPLHGWIITAGPGGDIDNRSLYSTEDGARTWHLRSGPRDFFARELSFANETTGFIAVPAVKDQPARLLRTADRGVTWLPLDIAIS